MDRLTTKCSTIMIATRSKTLVYHSVDEVPDKLRKRLLETTRGINSATILIADKGGREELLEAMRRSRPDRYSKHLSTLLNRKNRRGLPMPKWMFALPLIGRFLIVGSLGYVLWVLATLP